MRNSMPWWPQVRVKSRIERRLKGEGRAFPLSSLAVIFWLSNWTAGHIEWSNSLTTHHVPA